MQDRCCPRAHVSQINCDYVYHSFAFYFAVWLQAVDVVGQAGKPKTITGFQTHTTPVLLAYGERAELATEECILYTCENQSEKMNSTILESTFKQLNSSSVHSL